MNEKSQGRAIVTVVGILLVLALASAVFFGTYAWQQRKVTDLDKQVGQLRSQLADAQKPGTPQATANNSPLVVLGEVPGSWSFEASFPVVLKDKNGNTVAQTTAQLLDDWMTSKLVPFSAKLEYGSKDITEGTLVLQKDNPSELPANDDSVTIPLNFK